jgi:hypothetical protein
MKSVSRPTLLRFPSTLLARDFAFVSKSAWIGPPSLR